MTPYQANFVNVSARAAAPSAPPRPSGPDLAASPASCGAKFHHHASIQQVLEELAAAVATGGLAAQADESLADFPPEVFIDNAAVHLRDTEPDGSVHRPWPRPTASTSPEQPRADQSGAFPSEELQ